MSNWFQNAVIYQILIDRFTGDINKSNSNTFLGGTLHGIYEKLDYLKNMGVNAIWISPFFESKEYHGYHITDFEKIDPHFGNFEDLKKLIEIAHSKNIKIIADFVPNHCSHSHPFFIEAQKNRASKYFNWFYFKNWPNDYLCFLDFKVLPKLNLENPEVAEYIINNAKKWISYGFDALRLDHAIGPKHHFWEKFNYEIKKEYPDVLLIGEVWGKGIKRKDYKTLNFNNKLCRKIFGISQENLQKEYINVFDGILDYKLYELLIQTIQKKDMGLTSEKFKNLLKKHFAKYPKNFYIVSFLDNHDVNRFLYYCNGDIDKLIIYLKFIFSLNTPVVIYYNTETGNYNKEGITLNSEYSDLSVREPFNWQLINFEIFTIIQTLSLQRSSKKV